jgi:hypothetical protein
VELNGTEKVEKYINYEVLLRERGGEIERKVNKIK